MQSLMNMDNGEQRLASIIGFWLIPGDGGSVGDQDPLLVNLEDSKISEVFNY